MPSSFCALVLPFMVEYVSKSNKMNNRSRWINPMTPPIRVFGVALNPSVVRRNNSAHGCSPRLTLRESAGLTRGRDGWKVSVQPNERFARTSSRSHAPRAAGSRPPPGVAGRPGGEGVSRDLRCDSGLSPSSKPPKSDCFLEAFFRSSNVDLLLSCTMINDSAESVSPVFSATALPGIEPGFPE